MMKLTKVITIAIAAFAIGNVAVAQSYVDAARYSKFTGMGTARSTSMAGAFTAIGGDMSAIVRNPAGAGVYVHSEAAATLTPTFGKNSATALGLSIEDKRNSWQLDNLGLVLAFQLNPNSKWNYVNLGFSYTNINNFSSQSHRYVDYSKNSLTHVWAAQSAGLNSDELEILGSQLGYDTYLINPIYDENGDFTGDYFSVLDYDDLSDPTTDPVSQNEWVKERGFQGEYTLSLAGNFKDKFYLGGSLGLQQISYQYDAKYEEAAPLNAESGLDYFDYLTWEKQQGIGFNLNLGVIYKIISPLRIGVAIHTPTWYTMDYDARAKVDAYYNTGSDPSIDRTGDNKHADSYDYGRTSYSYRMRTAWRADFGIGFVLKQFLILSVEGNYIAYNKVKFSDTKDRYSSKNFSSMDPYQELNSDIRSIYKSRWNFGAGAEFRPFKAFGLRYGFNYQPTPYRYADESALTIHNCGVGFTGGNVFADVSYSRSKYKNTTLSYSWDGIESIPVSNTYKRDIVKLTIGYRF